MCVSQFKITFRAGDRCVPDCRVAARLRSSPLASHALFLSLFSGLRLQGWRGRGRAVSDIRGSLREMRRTCHPLSGGDDARGEVTHIEMPFSAVHYSTLAPTSEAGMRNGPYEKWLPFRA